MLVDLWVAAVVAARGGDDEGDRAVDVNVGMGEVGSL